MNRGFNEATAQSDDWQTPPWLFQALDAEFSFTMDGAANAENALCKKWFDIGSPETMWEFERVYVNPPYSDISPFVERASAAQLAVLLLPVRTDSDWFHKIIARNFTIRWFRKRIDFYMGGKPVGSPRFASMLAIMDNR